MRKSNFFNFIISIFDSNQQRVEVQKATFKDFYDTNVVSLHTHVVRTTTKIEDYPFLTQNTIDTDLEEDSLVTL